jgi:hypothetical protein
MLKAYMKSQQLCFNTMDAQLCLWMSRSNIKTTISHARLSA